MLTEVEADLTTSQDNTKAVREAIAQTDDEIMAFALDIEDPRDLPDPNSITGWGTKGRDGDDRSLEDVQDWDGSPMALPDIAAARHDGTMNRHLAEISESEHQLASERDQAVAQLKNLTGLLEHTHKEMVEPQLAAEHRRQQGQRLLDATMDDPDGTAERLSQQYAGTQQAMAVADHSRVEMSLQLAAHKHGDTFKRAYQGISGLDHRNPTHAALVQEIWRSPNPGEKMMEMHDAIHALRGGGQRGRSMPSLNGAGGGSGHSEGHPLPRGRGGAGMTDIGGEMVDLGSDADIFRSAFD